jgi:hypothetical protein
VVGALHWAADPGLEAEAVPPGPIRPGEAVRPIRWVLFDPQALETHERVLRERSDSLE